MKYRPEVLVFVHKKRACRAIFIYFSWTTIGKTWCEDEMLRSLLLLSVLPTLFLPAHCLGDSPCITPCSTACLNMPSPLCNCDASCGLFSDCCGIKDSPLFCPPSDFPPLQLGAELECRSVYLVEGVRVEAPEDAFRMVSSCPDSWPRDVPSVDNRTIVESCMSEDTGLPPVTDAETGLVFKNEFCALCNSVEHFRAWLTTLVCIPSVYETINELSLADILEEDDRVFARDCRPCSHQWLDAIPPPPRSCIPANSSCLNKTALEIQSGRSTSDSLYSQLVDDCRTAQRDIVVTAFGAVFSNADCAFCNDVSMDSLSCFTLRRSRDSPPIECSPESEAQSFTESPPSSPPPFIESTPGMGRSPFEPSGPEEQAPEYVIPFALTVSYIGGGEVSISSDTSSVIVPVECPKDQVPVGLECQLSLCPEAYVEGGGKCSVFDDESDPTNIPPGNCSSVLSLGQDEFVSLGGDRVLFEGIVLGVVGRDELDRSLVCNTTSKYVLPSCSPGFLLLNDTQFEDGGNGTIIFADETLEVLLYDSVGHPLVCPGNQSLVEANTSAVTSLPGVTELTYVGSSLSILGSAFVLVTYILFRRLRTLPGILLMNLSVAILTTNLLLVVGGAAMQRVPSVGLCSTFSTIFHFSYIAQFLWMSLFSIELMHRVYKAKKPAHPRRDRWWALPMYMIVGWATPLVIMGVTIGLNFGELSLYGVASTRALVECLINHITAYTVLFFVPLVLSLVIGLIMVIVISVLLWQLSKETSDLHPPSRSPRETSGPLPPSRSSSRIQPSNRYTLLRVLVAVLATTALTWVFGFVAVASESEWAWYLFVILNSSQGICISVVVLLSRRVRQLYVRLVTGYRPIHSSVEFALQPQRRASSASHRATGRRQGQRDVPPPIPERPDSTPPLQHSPDASPPHEPEYLCLPRQQTAVKKMDPSHVPQQGEVSPEEEMSPPHHYSSGSLQHPQKAMSRLQRGRSLPLRQRVLIQRKVMHPLSIRRQAVSQQEAAAERPLQQEAESSLQQEAGFPLQQEAESSLQQEAGFPLQQEAGFPLQQEAEFPLQKGAESPLQEAESSLQQELQLEAEAPLQQEAEFPLQQEAKSPLQQETPEAVFPPLQQVTPLQESSPLAQKGMPLFLQHRAKSPILQLGTSPTKQQQSSSLPLQRGATFPTLQLGLVPPFINVSPPSQQRPTSLPLQVMDMSPTKKQLQHGATLPILGPVPPSIFVPSPHQQRPTSLPLKAMDTNQQKGILQRETTAPTLHLKPVSLMDVSSTKQPRGTSLEAEFQLQEGPLRRASCLAVSPLLQRKKSIVQEQEAEFQLREGVTSPPLRRASCLAVSPLLQRKKSIVQEQEAEFQLREGRTSPPLRRASCLQLPYQQFAVSPLLKKSVVQQQEAELRPQEGDVSPPLRRASCLQPPHQQLAVSPLLQRKISTVQQQEAELQHQEGRKSQHASCLQLPPPQQLNVSPLFRRKVTQPPPITPPFPRPSNLPIPWPVIPKPATPEHDSPHFNPPIGTPPIPGAEEWDD